MNIKKSNNMLHEQYSSYMKSLGTSENVQSQIWNVLTKKEGKIDSVLRYLKLHTKSKFINLSDSERVINEIKKIIGDGQDSYKKLLDNEAYKSFVRGEKKIYGAKKILIKKIQECQNLSVAIKEYNSAGFDDSIKDLWKNKVLQLEKKLSDEMIPTCTSLRVCSNEHERAFEGGTVKSLWYKKRVKLSQETVKDLKSTSEFNQGENQYLEPEIRNDARNKLSRQETLTERDIEIKNCVDPLIAAERTERFYFDIRMGNKHGRLTKHDIYNLYISRRNKLIEIIKGIDDYKIPENLPFFKQINYIKTYFPNMIIESKLDSILYHLKKLEDEEIVDIIKLNIRLKQFRIAQLERVKKEIDALEERYKLNVKEGVRRARGERFSSNYSVGTDADKKRSYNNWCTWAKVESERANECTDIYYAMNRVHNSPTNEIKEVWVPVWENLSAKLVDNILHSSDIKKIEDAITLVPANSKENTLLRNRLIEMKSVMSY